MAENDDPLGSRLAGSTWRPSAGPYATSRESSSSSSGLPREAREEGRPRGSPRRRADVAGLAGPTPNSLDEPARGVVRFSRAEYKAPAALDRPIPGPRLHQGQRQEYDTPPEATPDGGYGRTPSSLEAPARGVHFSRAEHKTPTALAPVAEAAADERGYRREAPREVPHEAHREAYPEVIREERGAAHDPPDSRNSLEGTGAGRRMQRALESHREAKRSYTDRQSLSRERAGPGRRDGRCDEQDEIGVTAVDDAATEMTPLERWEHRKERKMRERGEEYVRPTHVRPSPDPRGPRVVTPTRDGPLPEGVADVARDGSARWSPREEDEEGGYEEGHNERYERYDDYGEDRRPRDGEPLGRGRRGDDRPDPTGQRRSSIYDRETGAAERPSGYRVGSDDVLSGSDLFDEVYESTTAGGNRSPLSYEERHESSPQRSAARPPPPPSRAGTRHPPPPPRAARRSSTHRQNGSANAHDDPASIAASVDGALAAHSPASDRDASTVERSHDGREYSEMERGTHHRTGVPEVAAPASPHDGAASRDRFSMNEDVRVRHRAADFGGPFGCRPRAGGGDKSKRKYLCITFVVCAACIIATALGIYYLSDKKDEEDIGRFGFNEEIGGSGEARESAPAAETPVLSAETNPTLRPTENPTGEREKTLGDYLYHLSNGQSERRGTAQHEAKRWILHEDELHLALPHSVEGPHGSYGQGSGRGDWESPAARRIRQRYALATLYYAMGIGDGGSAEGWLQGDECQFIGDGTTWDGVGCHEDGTVRALVLDGANLHGSIPHEVSLLSSIENLVIKNNPGLVGPIPANLGSHLSQLGQLGLYNNGLTGSIPRNVFKLSHLVYLNLADNSLAGTVHWQEIGSHQKKLQRLILHNNALEGSVDFHLLARATSLALLSLSNNAFDGHVDDTVGSLANLEYLYLDGNGLVGSIPDGITSLSKLQALNLDENELYGTLPGAIGEMASLTHLSAKGNTISGGLPESMKNLTSLETLNLASNAMSGDLRGLSTMPGLRNVHLYQNSFSGPIDGSLFTNMPHLEVLFLSSNSLTGGIPGEIRHAQRRLKGLYLSDNKLEGDIPREVCALYNLENLYLDTNAFGGALPSCLGNISGLQRLYAFGNRLTGDVPTGLFNLPHLTELGLEENDISGVIDEDGAATCERVIEKGLSIWADCNELQGGCACCEKCCSDQSNDC
ncbi:hypothetical protein ACHAXT_003808 [Thalassiosira profunda]